MTTIDTTRWAELATRALDLADRLEVAVRLAAASLRQMAGEVEEVIIAVAPPLARGIALDRSSPSSGAKR